MNWISVEERRPRAYEELLFTDGNTIYVGWLETYEPDEDLVFYAMTLDGHWPEGITHWASLKELPMPKAKLKP